MDLFGGRHLFGAYVLFLRFPLLLDVKLNFSDKYLNREGTPVKNDEFVRLRMKDALGNEFVSYW